jgi:hypothetical protein
MVGRRLQEINVLGGLILPVWGAVAKALAKQVCLFFIQKQCFLLLEAPAAIISSLHEVFILDSMVKFNDRMGLYMY